MDSGVGGLLSSSMGLRISSELKEHASVVFDKTTVVKKSIYLL